MLARRSCRPSSTRRCPSSIPTHSRPTTSRSTTGTVRSSAVPGSTTMTAGAGSDIGQPSSGGGRTPRPPGRASEPSTGTRPCHAEPTVPSDDRPLLRLRGLADAWRGRPAARTTRWLTRRAAAGAARPAARRLPSRRWSRGTPSCREVGRGGFGIVYRARQVEFNRTVALKVLTNVSDDPGARARFERECLAMGSLSGHPEHRHGLRGRVHHRRAHRTSRWSSFPVGPSPSDSPGGKSAGQKRPRSASRSVARCSEPMTAGSCTGM